MNDTNDAARIAESQFDEMSESQSSDGPTKLNTIRHLHNARYAGDDQMIAIQANEQGHPVVVEFVDGKLRTVDSDRWTEILAEGDITETPQAIIPVQVMDVPKHEGHAV